MTIAHIKTKAMTEEVKQPPSSSNNAAPPSSSRQLDSKQSTSTPRTSEGRGGRGRGRGGGRGRRGRRGTSSPHRGRNDRGGRGRGGRRRDHDERTDAGIDGTGGGVDDHGCSSGGGNGRKKKHHSNSTNTSISDGDSIGISSVNGTTGSDGRIQHESNTDTTPTSAHNPTTNLSTITSTSTSQQEDANDQKSVSERRDYKDNRERRSKRRSDNRDTKGGRGGRGRGIGNGGRGRGGRGRGRGRGRDRYGRDGNDRQEKEGHEDHYALATNTNNDASNDIDIPHSEGDSNVNTGINARLNTNINNTTSTATNSSNHSYNSHGEEEKKVDDAHSHPQRDVNTRSKSATNNNKNRNRKQQKNSQTQSHPQAHIQVEYTLQLNHDKTIIAPPTTVPDMIPPPPSAIQQSQTLSEENGTHMKRDNSSITLKSMASDTGSGSNGGMGMEQVLKFANVSIAKPDKAQEKDVSTSTSNNTNTNSNAANDKKDKKEKSKRKKTKSKKDKKATDAQAQQKAAKQFNKDVRRCVERSNPDQLLDLLHDKHNHKFALQADALEVVMKAFVVAAMFEDALYCLRHCTLPGTLSTIQTERILQCLPQNLRNSSAYVAADMINALCIATEFEKATHRTYFMRIVRGISLEFLEEATSARDRICSAPCERLVRSAVCIVDAQLRRGKKATELVIVPGNQLGVFVPETMENRGIQAGDAVGILPYAGPYPMSAESLDRNMIEATVTGVQPFVLRLQDKTNASLYAMLTEPAEGNVYRIDKLANRMGFNRQLAAAVSIASPYKKVDPKTGMTEITRSDIRRPSPELINAITAMDENIGDGSNIGKTANSFGHGIGPSGVLNSTAALCNKPVPWNSMDDHRRSNEYEMNELTIREDEDSIRDTIRLALDKYGAFDGLNASQRLAVEGAATNRLTLVQGPPGTGKTAVAIRIIEFWARLAANEAASTGELKPILATSDSNIAVDNLVEGCAKVGLRVVRLGRPEAIRPELLRYCIDRPQHNHNSNNGYGNGGGFGSAFKEKLKALKNAQVVCCTCIGSGADILDNMMFERVLVDEATQATEPAVLVPITNKCRQLVLVGDHCQLPPTVLSTRAEEEGLGVPLFSRMVACGVPPFMLDTQYRMHPSIAMFPSDLFYGGKLLNGVSAPERRPLAGFPWPREEFPVAFVPVNHGVEVDDGVSKLNEAEAAATCDAVSALLEGGQCTTADIAVVTPYAAQVRLIRRMTRKLVSSPPYIEVSSTDGFQGREKEAVIFSAVRSNDYGAVGFVSDWRRVNVSFTRARRALIVIGNDVTLRRGDPDTWMPWLAWADAHGINMDKAGIPRGRYDAEKLRRVRGGTTAAEMLKDVLERQQAQLMTAERQLEKAEKKASGHIVAHDSTGEMNGISGGVGVNTVDAQTLQQDLALLANSDGCWDDSDDDDDLTELRHSVSASTLVSASSAAKAEKEEQPQDAWDL